MDSPRFPIVPALLCTAVGLVLIVVVASAAIRLGQQALPPLGAGALFALRAVHRTAASLEVLVALWLAALAWRVRAEEPALARGAALALALTGILSAIGIAAGKTPPAAAAFGNVLGGLALAAVFAWTMGRARAPTARSGSWLRRMAAVLLAAQCAMGASVSILRESTLPVLPAHAILGLVLAAGAIWLARRARLAVQRAAGASLACLVPIAGFSVLHFEGSARAALVHAVVAALLVVAAAYMVGFGSLDSNQGRAAPAA